LCFYESCRDTRVASNGDCGLWVVRCDAVGGVSGMCCEIVIAVACGGDRDVRRVARGFAGRLGSGFRSFLDSIVFQFVRVSFFSFAVKARYARNGRQEFRTTRSILITAVCSLLQGKVTPWLSIDGGFCWCTHHSAL
jgi:hypothetical protein